MRQHSSKFILGLHQPQQACGSKGDSITTNNQTSGLTHNKCEELYGY
jgi:hypothetical protein